MYSSIIRGIEPLDEGEAVCGVVLILEGARIGDRFMEGKLSPAGKVSIVFKCKRLPFPTMKAPKLDQMKGIFEALSCWLLSGQDQEAIKRKFRCDARHACAVLINGCKCVGKVVST